MGVGPLRMRICFDQDPNLHPARTPRDCLSCHARRPGPHRATTRGVAGHAPQIGTRKGRRVLGCYHQAVMVLRWFRDDTSVRLLARDAGMGIPTAYRYLHEGIDVLAAQAPDLHD